MPSGYGKININKKSWLAHRFVLFLKNGFIDSEKVVDHLCKNPSCVNPEHLELVTQKENIIRGKAKEAKRATWATNTHCVNGHEFTEQNTVWHFCSERDRPRRKCKICQNKYTKKYRSKFHEKQT